MTTITDDTHPSESECHFTYNKPVCNDIAQGDLLSKTDELIELLNQIHPHYTKVDYTHFLILTQTCDLVRRGGHHCKARYISLAPVRPLSLVVNREIEKYQGSELEKKAQVCGLNHKSKLMQFVEKLLNNNDADFFYLHAEKSIGFNDPSCAFLRLPISIRASDHYVICEKARILSLRDVFQAKLGWLVGNLYSRVGTDDWVPDHSTSENFKVAINRILDESHQWVDDKQLKLADKNIDPAITDFRQLRELILKIPVKNRRETALERVISVLLDMKIVVDSRQAEKVVARLKSDPVFSSVLK